MYVFEGKGARRYFLRLARKINEHGHKKKQERKSINFLWKRRKMYIYIYIVISIYVCTKEKK